MTPPKSDPPMALQSKLKLVVFTFGGGGRFRFAVSHPKLLALAGVPYEDHRYRFTFGKPGDFSTISMPEFEADKAAGACLLVFGDGTGSCFIFIFGSLRARFK